MEGLAPFESYSTVVYSPKLLETKQSVNMAVKREMKPESVALHPVGAAGALQLEVTGIFGTRDLCRSLGLRLLQSGYRVVYSSH